MKYNFTLSLLPSYHVSEEFRGKVISLSLGQSHTEEVLGCEVPTILLFFFFFSDRCRHWSFVDLYIDSFWDIDFDIEGSFEFLEFFESVFHL